MSKCSSDVTERSWDHDDLVKDPWLFFTTDDGWDVGEGVEVKFCPACGEKLK